MLLATLEQLLGLLLIGIVLVDVFLTVLYARMGGGIMSYRLAGLTWRIFRLISRPFRRSRSRILSFCGPVILVVVVGVWTVTLTLGEALVIHPKLGTEIVAASGDTGTDFVTAIYVGGSGLSLVSSSDYTPHTPILKLFLTLSSLIGMTAITLIITYLMEVYSALQNRNALGLKVHTLANSCQDAAEIVAGCGPDGRFEIGYTNLADLATELTAVKESHHFYPVLYYFRFQEAYYSVSSTCLMALDTAALIKSALSDEHYGWLKESATVVQLWRSALMLVTTLEEIFLPGGAPEAHMEPNAETHERWRQRYLAALRRLRQAGIHTIEDEEAGAEIYIALRNGWDLQIGALAPALAYTMDEIDPIVSNPAASDDREPFRTRLTSFI